MSGVAQKSLSVETLYTDYHRWLHGILQRRLGNRDDAADLAHDAFIRLLTKPRHLSHHTARAYLSLLHLPEQESPSAEQQTAALEALVEIDTMLRRLPDAVAHAFIQSMVHGLTGKEIATQLGVSERTVRNHLSKAMLACLRLQARLEGAGTTAPS